MPTREAVPYSNHSRNIPTRAAHRAARTNVSTTVTTSAKAVRPNELAGTNRSKKNVLTGGSASASTMRMGNTTTPVATSPSHAPPTNPSEVSTAAGVVQTARAARPIVRTSGGYGDGARIR